MPNRSRNITGLDQNPTAKRGRGRPRLYVGALTSDEQIRLPLPAGSRARIRAALDDGESVSGFIRAAIEREIKRRGRP